MIKTQLPNNNVNIDYNSVLSSFVNLITQKQKDNIKSIFLTGSYARGDASNSSDFDVWCVFDCIDSSVLYEVGTSSVHVSSLYDNAKINTQCLSIEECKSQHFWSWTEAPVKILDGILLYGEDLFGDTVSIPELELIYKKYLADILMGIRHYICVDKPLEKLTYERIRTYILKPLMFPLRLERYCICGYYPRSNYDLLNAYDNEVKELVQYFLHKEKFDSDIAKNHREVLCKMHHIVSELLK